MDRVNLLDGFQLDNDAVLNQYVELEVGAHAMSFVCDGNSTFALGSQRGLAEFDEQAFAVNGFQQSRTKGAVYFNRATNNPITDQFDILRLPV
jgi:hypothetical protein